MVLRTLEMQGFKSFPDKTQLNFGNGITAVVGPNGSGKSNIADAVRWVLGETSTKSLRGSKMEDVIFSGTSSRKALGFAQVQLTLDNSDGTLKERGEIVTVSRRYYRSGESEYKIDGEQVRRKDIHELFMDTGLGSDGYSLVGQGKIESIISEKNDDRRELFEEAAGISLFRHKRTDATRRLDQAQENLVRLLDILGELESRVEPLRKQSEKAAKFLELSEEKKMLEIGVWVNKINRFTNDLREQDHKIDAADASYKICEQELTDIENEINEILEKTALINTEVDQLRALAKANEEEALREDGKVMVLENTVAHNSETIDRLNAEINSTDDANHSIDSQIEEKKQIIADGEILLAAKKDELKMLSAEMEKLTSSNEENSKHTVELNQLITALTVELSDCKVRCSQAVSSIEEIKSRRSVVDDAISAMDKEVDIALSQQEEAQKNLDFLQERIDENNNSLSGYRLKHQNKSKRAEDLKDSLEKLSFEISQKRSRAKMLLDLEKNMEGFSGAVRSVMKQSQSNALSGIHGPLSQLITVDNEYSVAVEVALGAAMQNIVTTNEADAKRAIYYLKNNKLGRATFLPISAIKPRNFDEKNLDDALGFVAVAADIVQCKSEYKDIISNLLGRVVIVEDMDCAIGISKRYGARFKIVTLDGQVINTGGSMTGGSQAKSAGILSRANLIDELNSQAKELEEKLENLKAQYKTAVEEANYAGAKLQGAEADLQQAKEELIRAQGDYRLICEKLDAAKAQKSSLIDEKENASARISELQKTNEQSEKQAGEIELKISDAENQLKETSSNATELEEKREKFRLSVQEINLELVTVAKDIETAKISIEELELRKNTQSDRVKSTIEEISSIEEKNSEYNLEIDKIKANADAYRKKAQDALVSVDSKIDERNQLEKRSAELRTFERNKNQEREKLNGEIVRLTEHKNNMRKEYDELNDMLFEQYELTKREAEALNIQIEDMTAAKKRLHEIKVSIKALGSINVGAIEEYKEVSERYEFLKAQIDDVEKSKSELLKIIEDLTASMSEKFLDKFNKINTEFSISFADFFGGGKGEIVLRNPDDCLESEIDIKIQPPGKSVQNINLFSGGEKSLAAMALLFSVLKVQPAPFCIYDEVEAALDDVNVERFAKYMRKMTENTQFISITHRRGTMEEADVLYGVTMQEKGVSKLIELQTAELAAKMGLEE
ncbi:MAG: chromosome segregation protein SMC [Eubacterium sp.]|nr:chromosome segregation protein SMC [Eubacterium sp.]